MNSFLITFKPVTESPKRGWPLTSLQKLARLMTQKKKVSDSWRFRNQKDVSVGDRVFLLMQGRLGPAIVGYGQVEEEGGPGWRAIRFEALVDPVINVLADRRKLLAIKGASSWWRTQFSGVCLPKRIALELEALVVDKESKQSKLALGSSLAGNMILEAREGREILRTYVTRVRSRGLAQKKRNQVWMRYGRMICEVCGFDFSALYGVLADGVIECHHTKPVRTLRSESKTHIDDLALLCANCHRVLHKGKFTIPKLRAMIKKHSSPGKHRRSAAG